ncbi:hypothetical protein ACQPX6_08780 [Actinomycetospora sp. CA-101289]|uniref:hypothetical protein n=1 Tax=Actinomycetospora sp. CA-101289 TaxID=3239893 RepID=UPI003D978950
MHQALRGAGRLLPHPRRPRALAPVFGDGLEQRAHGVRGLSIEAGEPARPALAHHRRGVDHQLGLEPSLLSATELGWVHHMHLLDRTKRTSVRRGSAATPSASHEIPTPVLHGLGPCSRSAGQPTPAVSEAAATDHSG